jgi:hypothetical protein
MRVVNVRGMTPNTPGVTYVGRACRGWPPSVLANLYVMGSEADRPRALSWYRDWLDARIAEDDRAVVSALLDLPADAVLGCWCVDRDGECPAGAERCHAELVAKAARRLREGG